MPFVLVGCKSDARTDGDSLAQLALEGRSPIALKDAQTTADMIGAFACMECSAKEQQGVTEIFITATEAALNYKTLKRKRSGRSGFFKSITSKLGSTIKGGGSAEIKHSVQKMNAATRLKKEALAEEAAAAQADSARLNRLAIMEEEGKAVWKAMYDAASPEKKAAMVKEADKTERENKATPLEIHLRQRDGAEGTLGAAGAQDAFHTGARALPPTPVADSFRSMVQQHNSVQKSLHRTKSVLVVQTHSPGRISAPPRQRSQSSASRSPAYETIPDIPPVTENTASSNPDYATIPYDSIASGAKSTCTAFDSNVRSVSMYLKKLDANGKPRLRTTGTEGDGSLPELHALELDLARTALCEADEERDSAATNSTPAPKKQSGEEYAFLNFPAPQSPSSLVESKPSGPLIDPATSEDAFVSETTNDHDHDAGAGAGAGAGADSLSAGLAQHGTLLVDDSAANAKPMYGAGASSMPGVPPQEAHEDDPGIIPSTSARRLSYSNPTSPHTSPITRRRSRSQNADQASAVGTLSRALSSRLYVSRRVDASKPAKMLHRPVQLDDFLNKLKLAATDAPADVPLTFKAEPPNHASNDANPSFGLGGTLLVPTRKTQARNRNKVDRRARSQSAISLGDVRAAKQLSLQDEAEKTSQFEELGLSDAEAVEYQRMWTAFGSKTGTIGGAKVFKMFAVAGVSKAIGKTIWSQADKSLPHGRLTETEFYVALKLVAMQQIESDIDLATAFSDVLPRTGHPLPQREESMASHRASTVDTDVDLQQQGASNADVTNSVASSTAGDDGGGGGVRGGVGNGGSAGAGSLRPPFGTVAYKILVDDSGTQAVADSGTSRTTTNRTTTNRTTTNRATAGIRARQNINSARRALARALLQPPVDPNSKADVRAQTAKEAVPVPSGAQTMRSKCSVCGENVHVHDAQPRFKDEDTGLYQHQSCAGSEVTPP